MREAHRVPRHVSGDERFIHIPSMGGVEISYLFRDPGLQSFDGFDAELARQFDEQAAVPLKPCRCSGKLVVPVKRTKVTIDMVDRLLIDRHANDRGSDL